MGSKIKIAVIGVGYWGPNAVRSFSEDPRVEVSVVCDASENRLVDIRNRFPHISTTTRIEEVVQNAEIAAAVICTPTRSHYAIAKELLLSGKHVLVEKPLATKTSECEELIAVAKKQDRKLMVGHIFLFHPGILYIDQMIQSGELGKIVYLYSTRVNLGPIRSDVHALWDLGPHDISIFNYWLRGTPEAVNCTGVAHINPALLDVAFLSARYPDNVLANMHVSWLDPKKTRRIVIVGSKKMAVFDDLDPNGPVTIYDKAAAIQYGSAMIPKLPALEPLREECSAFIRWILEGVEPRSTGLSGRDVVKVLECADVSLENNGMEVSVRQRPLLKLAS